jgi:hypothetical protein
MPLPQDERIIARAGCTRSRPPRRKPVDSINLHVNCFEMCFEKAPKTRSSR